MKQHEKCSFCGGRLVKKGVEKFLRSNGDTAILKVNADVCMNCGMKFYRPGVIARYAEVKKKLKKGQTKGFILTGKSYEVS